MHVTSLEIILAVVAVFVVFGPKELPRRSKQPAAVKAKKVERATLIADQYGAGRAPSPLQLRAAERPMRAPGEVAAKDRPQFANGNREGSPLPHELLSV